MHKNHYLKCLLRPTRDVFLNLDIIAFVAKIEDINAEHNRDTFVYCIFVTLLLMLVVLKAMML